MHERIMWIIFNYILIVHSLREYTFNTKLLPIYPKILLLFHVRPLIFLKFNPWIMYRIDILIRILLF